MRFDEKLKKQSRESLWNEYCSFLDLDIHQYMYIQNRLMEEQISLWSASGIGRRLLKGKTPKTVEEFRRDLPLTSFSDYADVLLARRTDMLPAEPVIWIETTWEGGKHPVKLAPYTRGMLDVYQTNVISALILCTSSGRGSFSVMPNDRTLFGFAPLPYATGLFPLLLDEEIKVRFLPPVDAALKMSFGERNRKGFAMGLNQGIDLFFGLSSVISYITQSFTEGGGSGGIKRLFHMSPQMAGRFLVARYRCRRDGVPVRPKDVFRLKGMVCAGTDTQSFKNLLEEAWGCRPMEIAAGTESTCIGTETWLKNGLVFFPNACFYEFIPEDEMMRSIDDPSYQPYTCLMNELTVGANYELVISVLKGGAFARYRVGDVYRCVSTGGGADGVCLPKLTFVDRVPTVIDIAGFTRITESTISDVITLSGLHISEWFAAKEYDEERRPFLHLYLEMDSNTLEWTAVSRQVLAEHLSVYFKYFDNDYRDLKKMLRVEPLQITILRSGTVRLFTDKTGEKVRRINPPARQIAEILCFQRADFETGRSAR